jgi:urease accessory protein
MNPSAFKLWQLISPTLPVGAYSYSQALETLGVARLDLPMLLRVHRAWAGRDALAVRRWSRALEARRETAELRFEDLAMGTALAQLLANLGVDVPERCLPFASAFAVAAVAWSIPAEDASAGYAWAWCEAQVAAAVKLVPLGHTAGQRTLLALGLEIPAVLEIAAACRDDEIGVSLPGLAIASALHETQYTRLFRS